MKLLSKNCNLESKYYLIDDQTLSFKDKVLKYLDIDEKPQVLDNLMISGNEVELFKKRLDEAYKNNEKVLLVSDYDCDGVLSLAIMKRLLDRLKIKANYYIPSRIKEGYGINQDIVKMAKNYNFDLIITLDNGVVAKDAINLALEYDIDVMVVDHHEYIDRPNVKALIHPKVLSDEFKGLCTGGLSYFISKLYYQDEYLNILAMITTLADVCVVLNANRKILIDGLNYLNQNPSKYLPIYNLEKKSNYSFEDISFKIIPKINAISRMDHLTNINILAKYFIELENNNFDTALQINHINDMRKDLTSKMTNKANALIENKAIELIYDDSFHEGLCGLIANQLVNEINRPCIVLGNNHDILKGSGRAVDGFDIHDYFKDFKDEFNSFGGHKKAIGLSIKKDKLDDLKEYINNHPLNIEDSLIKLIKIDEDDLTLENIEFLDSLKPYGEGLKEPLFYIDNVKVVSKFIIKGLYPKYTLDNKAEAIAFNPKLNSDNIRGFIAKLGFNSFNNKKKINISIDEIVV